MKLQLVKKVKKKDWLHLTSWRKNVFPEEGLDLEWSPLKWHILAYSEKNEAIGHLGFSEFIINLEDLSECRVVGVGGMVVHPDYQCKGVPKVLFEYLHKSEIANSISGIFTGFYPSRLEEFYQLFRYEPYKGSVSFLQKGKMVAADPFRFCSRGAAFDCNKIFIKSAPW